MENTNQDVMMDFPARATATDSGGPIQIPGESTGLGEADNNDPTDTEHSGETTNSGAPSGSPNMEPDSEIGTGESIGNGDTYEIGPERPEEEFLK